MHDADLRHAGAVLEIDLAAIRANWRSLAARTRGACAAVVKADAYGLGAAVVAPTLHDEGARRFFVAHLDEALVLQPALPTGTEILVLNGLPPGAEGDCAAGIVPVLNSLPQVDARTDPASRKGRPLPAALQVDTGMSRMGLDEAELDALAVDPTRLLGINLRLVMSQLACAERQDHEMNAPSSPASRPPAVRSQRRRRASPSPRVSSSARASTSTSPAPTPRGLAPVMGESNPMRPVARLSGRIVQIRDIPAGARVGYGAGWTAPRPSTHAAGDGPQPSPADSISWG